MYKVLVTQSCPTLCDPMDCSPPGSSVHRILRARILEWVAISFSRGSFWLRDQTWISCIVGKHFTVWATSKVNFRSDQINRSVMSDSLWAYELQHTRPPCPHYLPEFAQTRVHWVGDLVQLSHPLSPPFPPAHNLSQHQGLFQWAGSSHRVPKVLELQHQSCQWIFRVDFL